MDAVIVCVFLKASMKWPYADAKRAQVEAPLKSFDGWDCENCPEASIG